MGRRMMEVPVAVIKLDYVNEYTDRTGKKRRYFRRRGKRLGALPGEVGSEEFMAAYQGFLAENKPAIPSPRTGDGSFGRLITEYYGSTPFKNLKPSSRTAYRYALEPLAKAHGHRLVRDMRADKIAKIIGDIGATKPGMANFTKSVVQKLMKYAVKAKWRPDNPVIGIERFKSGTHHTWTEGELKTFEISMAAGDAREGRLRALALHHPARGRCRQNEAGRHRGWGIARYPGQDRSRAVPAHPSNARAGNEGVPCERPGADRNREREAADLSWSIRLYGTRD